MTVPNVDPAEVRRALTLLYRPGEVFEVRALDVQNARFNGRPEPRPVQTASGYFDTPDAAARIVEHVFGGATTRGVYVTLNPTVPALLARSANAIKPIRGKDPTTADHDVARRVRLLVDCDPKRPAGISASEEEREASRIVALAVRDYLASRGWPAPVLADSGNGFHLLYRIDLPAKDEDAKCVLEALSARFSTDVVSVDTTVFNPARIVKLYGTAARKGDDIPNRPHRMSRLLEIPDDWQRVPAERLRELAAEAPAPATPRPTWTAPALGSFDLDAFASRHFPAARPQPWQGGTRFLLAACPFDASHTGGSAALFRHPSGAVSFKCQHNSCAGRRWDDVRALLDPRPARPAMTEPVAQAITYEWLAPPAPPERVTLAPAALYGLAGHWAEAVAPHTEGDPLGILVTLLAEVGVSIGRSPHFLVGAERHGVNLFACLVGPTSEGRKGTASSEGRRALRLAGPGFPAPSASGLSSGEGFAWCIRDEIVGRDRKTGEEVVLDEGVEDKRLLVVETELASVLRRMANEGNSLSALMRQAWDGHDLCTLTKKPVRATEPHVGLVAHVTPAELAALMTETETLNGWGNRIMFFSVRRPHLLPHGGAAPESVTIPLAHELQDVITFARGVGPMQRDEQAEGAWERVYEALTSDRGGLFGAITARAAQHVIRLSMLYALLDRSAIIRAPHLKAALALWQAASDSARILFGGSLGDRVADDIRIELQEAPDGLTRGKIYDLFKRNVPSGRIAQALALLARLGLARGRKETTEGRGRPAERWFSLETPYVENALNAEIPPDRPAQPGNTAFNAFNASGPAGNAAAGGAP